MLLARILLAVVYTLPVSYSSRVHPSIYHTLCISSSVDTHTVTLSVMLVVL